MAAQVKLVYTIEPTGASSAAVAALMSAANVPVPPDLLQAAGLRVTSDVTAVADPVTRTIILMFGPTTNPTAVATLDNQDQVDAVNVTAPGIDLILPPQVSFAGGSEALPGPPLPLGGSSIIRRATAQAFLNMQGVALVAGGTGYSASTVAYVLGAMAPPVYTPTYPPGYGRQEALGEVKKGLLPPSCVQGLSIGLYGKGYTSQATIQFQGGLDSHNPNARSAQAGRITLGPKGEIYSVQLLDPGEGYIEVPRVVVVDPGVGQTSGGLMVMRPDPISGKRFTANTAGAQFGDATPSSINYVEAVISPIMGQGTAATVALTIAGGVITAAVVSGNGARYTGVPQIFIYDPTNAGSGGILTARMGLGEVDLMTGGQGYIAPPSVVLTPAFYSFFPMTGDERAPFWNLMQPALQKATMSPVSSAAPVLS
jgi:hypothetical protein